MKRKYYVGDFKKGQPDDTMGLSLSDFIPKISTFNDTLKSLGKVAGNIIRVVNPINVTTTVIKAVPVAKDVYREVDKFTGGTLESITRVSNIPSKILSGAPISKAEMLEVLTTAIKVGAIVASGGSAASIVAVAAGQLKQGTLGQSALGRNLLTVAEIAGTAAAIQSAAAGQAAAQAAEAGTAQTATMTAGQAAQKATENYAGNILKSKVEEEFEKKTGIPVSTATTIIDVSTGNKSIATLPKDIAKKVGEQELKKLGFGDTMTQAILSNNAKAVGAMIDDAPNLLLSKAQREINAQKTKLLAYASVDGLKQKAIEATEKFKREATDAQALKAKLDKEVDSRLKAEYQKQLDGLLRKVAGSQKESVDLSYQALVEQGRAGVLVAAAEEGRYSPSNALKPVLVAGGVGLTALVLYATIVKE